MICDVSLLLFAIRQQTLLIAALLHTCLATLNATKHTSIKHSSFITTYNVMMRQIWPWCIPCDVQYVYITMYTSLFLVKGLNKAFLISLNILNLTIIFRKNLYSMLSENLAIWMLPQIFALLYEQKWKGVCTYECVQQQYNTPLWHCCLRWPRLV